MNRSICARLMLVVNCLLLPLALAGCSSTGVPRGIEPVDGFDLTRYLGTWYEIARMDHKFERGLERVTAEYALNDDGTVKVINRGYASASDKWKTATGKARFVEQADTGHLKVSFFGPFYGSYIVYELDREYYQYALVSGPDRSYMWLLSRRPVIDDELYEQLLSVARENGFNTEALIRVNHSS